MDVKIRPIQKSEISEVQKLGKKCFSKFESLMIPKPEMANVAVLNNQIVGAVLYKVFHYKRFTIGYIDYAFVDQKYNGQGLGQLLYQQTVNQLWDLNCDYISAIVKDDNVTSFTLFQKHKFYRVTALLMVKELGVMNTLKQWIDTPIALALGMEYYIAKKDGSTIGETSHPITRWFLYFLLNLALISIVSLRRDSFSLQYLSAVSIIFIGLSITGYIVSGISRNHWRFRLVEGGSLVHFLVSIFGGFLPFLGNWYPVKYQKSREQTLALAVISLSQWMFIVCLIWITWLIDNTQLSYQINQVTTEILILFIIPFYPISIYGSSRIMAWSRWTYALIVFLSIVTIVVNWI